MSGIIVIVYARAPLARHIGEVATASVACGVMGVGGNKGAAAVTFTLFRRRFVVVSSHFAAHQDNVAMRNADYAKIVRSLKFHATAARETDTSVDASGGVHTTTLDAEARPMGDDERGTAWGAGMREAEAVVWMGDFNYRRVVRAGLSLIHI